ncbi:MAG: AAA family ATPase [Nitrospinae bacterium]|nr:AAA family ATPase [Nitrospinota bacterium]
MRRLAKKWASGGAWPKRLEWLELKQIRGWEGGQRISFSFPIVAIVGENGSGKSTLLQAAACAYKAEEVGRTWYPSEFFPDTAWDSIQKAAITYGYMQGSDHLTHSITKLTKRWLRQVERPIRAVRYIDLSRIQPVATRVGYARIAKTEHQEASAVSFDEAQVKRLSQVMNRPYDSAKMALTNIDTSRKVPVLTRQGIAYSGYHQGAGETTIAELLQVDFPKYGLVLIDEVESSLHPRAQRQLIRDLAEQCREREVQIILSTHSPYILEELPQEARLYIFEMESAKKIIPGVSPEFAMTKMDDEAHPECDLYVEDEASKIFLSEILACHGKEVFPRCVIVPFGAASVGSALGQMVAKERFRRPSRVFLDGDSTETDGCILLPGNDAPEQVVFNGLQQIKFGDVWTRIGRDISEVSDAFGSAMTLNDHHDWVTSAANRLLCGGSILWQSMCAEWAKKVLTSAEAVKLIKPIEDVLP